MQLSEIPKHAGIYLLTNRITNKQYVGKSVNLYSRIMVHKYRQPKYHIDFSLRKYGLENFDIEIIHFYETMPSNALELVALETACIESYNTLYPNGYNHCFYGTDNSGVKRSDEAKLKYSLSKLGKKNPNFGKIIPRTRESYLGQNNGRFDKNIYHFLNQITGQIFKGHRQTFYQSFNLSKENVGAMIRGKQKSVKNWVLT